MAESHPYYDGVQTALLADVGSPTVSELAAGGIYSGQLPNDNALPALRYAILFDNPHQRLSDGDNTTAELQFDAYTKRGDESTGFAIDRAVKRVMDRQDITVSGFTRVHVMRIAAGAPFREDKYNRVRSRYRIYGSAA